MTRLNHKGEYWSHLDSVELLRDQATTPGSTTVDTDAAVGDTSIGVASTTNFTDGDIIRIGERDRLEINQLEGAIADPLLLRFPLAYPHLAADAQPVVEQQAFDLGNILDAGARITFSGDHNPVNAATKRLVTAYLTGHAEIMAEFELLGFALENLAVSLGMAESFVLGSGTSAAPTTIAITADDFNTENDLSWRFTGATKQGEVVLLDLWATENDFSAVNFQMQRGTPAPVPVRAKATSGLRVSKF